MTLKFEEIPTGSVYAVELHWNNGNTYKIHTHCMIDNMGADVYEALHKLQLAVKRYDDALETEQDRAEYRRLKEKFEGK